MSRRLKSPLYPLDRRLGGPQCPPERRGEEKILDFSGIVTSISPSSSPYSDAVQKEKILDFSGIVTSISPSYSPYSDAVQKAPPRLRFIWAAWRKLRNTYLRTSDLQNENRMRNHVRLYKKYPEVRSVFWEVTLSVTLNKKRMCPIPSGFRDTDISLYSSKIVDKKEILRTVSNTGNCSSNGKVGTVYLALYILENYVNVTALCASCEDVVSCSSIQGTL
jgi:hypothetical protein